MVSNSINLAVTSGRAYLKRTAIVPVVLWVMPRGCVTNHTGVEEELIIYWSHTIHNHPTSHFQYCRLRPLSSVTSITLFSYEIATIKKKKRGCFLKVQFFSYVNE